MINAFLKQNQRKMQRISLVRTTKLGRKESGRNQERSTEKRNDRIETIILEINEKIENVCTNYFVPNGVARACTKFDTVHPIDHFHMNSMHIAHSNPRIFGLVENKLLELFNEFSRVFVFTNTSASSSYFPSILNGKIQYGTRNSENENNFVPRNYCSLAISNIFFNFFIDCAMRITCRQYSIYVTNNSISGSKSIFLLVSNDFITARFNHYNSMLGGLPMVLWFYRLERALSANRHFSQASSKF